MSELLNGSAAYCPACGTPVESVEAVRADEGFSPAHQGVFEKEGAHLVVEANEARIYAHAGDGS